ncbi:hypothetical protein BYT27DRAFT_6665346 [Phlegmacium glaucopus]|nr:hypothetical protein BYT27DRAFT_6665346 [Phlegmacium glaucopus]
MHKDQGNPYKSPTQLGIVAKPSTASISCYQFGGEQTIRAHRGLLERQGLEDSQLSADGEEWRALVVLCLSLPGLYHYTLTFELISHSCTLCPQLQEIRLVLVLEAPATYDDTPSPITHAPVHETMGEEMANASSPVQSLLSYPPVFA